jgi:hypothetical protein
VNHGYLSSHFAGVGVKTLSGTEIDLTVSGQHEFQGVEAFQTFLGVPTEKRRLPARYVWLTDEEDPAFWDGEATWYDCRKGQKGRTPEPRLYYPKGAEPVVFRAKAKDTLFTCYGRDGALTFFMCPAGSTIEKQLLWLFGLTILGEDMVERDLREVDIELGLPARYVLNLIGVEARVEDTSWLAGLVRSFGTKFPTTARFSAFARKAAGPLDAQGDPDGVLVRWLELEELLFYTFERHLISQRLQDGFSKDGHADVESFIKFSLSVHQRRKSRAGYSLENHLQFLFDEFGLRYQRGARTEGKRKPDFLFPGSVAYHDTTYPRDRLTLLGSKSSCKDRWRQVLSEGALVPEKHLVTLEPGISVNQTNEMRQERLQLVLPAGLHATYQPEQQNWLMSVAGFIDLVKARQGAE